MKKKYIQPAIEVATIRINTNVLQSSIDQVIASGLGDELILDDDGNAIDGV